MNEIGFYTSFLISCVSGIGLIVVGIMDYMEPKELYLDLIFILMIVCIISLLIFKIFLEIPPPQGFFIN
jgi:anaerobic C4-dicarboxylate transporter